MYRSHPAASCLATHSYSAPRSPYWVPFSFGAGRPAGCGTGPAPAWPTRSPRIPPGIPPARRCLAGHPEVRRRSPAHRPGGLLFHRLRPHRPAPCQKRTGQRRCQHPSSHGMFSCFQRAEPSAPLHLFCPAPHSRDGKGQGKTFGFPQLICLRQLKNLKPFSAGYAPAENTWTQPPWAASPVTAVVARGSLLPSGIPLTVRMLPGPTHRWPARCSCPWPPRPGAGPHLQRIPPGPGASPHPSGSTASGLMVTASTSFCR